MDKLSIQYVPVLKWRMAEYQALHRLYDLVKDRIIPLVNIPPIEYDFEERRLKKTAHEQVEPFPEKFKSKWGGRKAFVDIDESLHDEFMDNGDSVVNYVFDELHIRAQEPIPVTGISRSKNYQAVIKAAHKKLKSGLALRVRVEELMHPDASNHIAGIIKTHRLNYDEIDLIIDLGVPQSFEPYGVFAKALAKRIKSIASLDSFRSLIVVATSINISDVKPPGDVIQRHEWSLYKALVDELGEDNAPMYGDYCIELPGYSSLDMRFIKPAGKVVYATEDSWFIRKGGAFRGNEHQMIRHCKDVIASGFYKGAEYSWGDETIYNTANESKGCGNMTTWKQVGFSHHITFVTEQLSILHGS
ncbi:MAG: hypothetical protein GXP14_15190 [Gammaproteobacteria bacterium]|nr:hypothetical protein [Gammaproteobacteria bacterium]